VQIVTKFPLVAAQVNATAVAIHTVHNTKEPTRDVLASKQNKVGTDVIFRYNDAVDVITPLIPPALRSGQRLFQEPPAKSKFLAFVSSAFKQTQTRL